MQFKDDKNSDQIEVTHVDLGSDLIEKTAGGTLGGKTTTHERHLLEEIKDIPDALNSAKILESEGLLEEAKKILRKILLHDSHCVEAKKRLQGIHEIEIKQIFSDESSPTPLKADPFDVDNTALIQRLDHDLAMRGTSTKSILTKEISEFSLFQDQNSMEAFAFRLERELKGCSVKDRMDIGIAFLEMGLYEIAISQFKAVIRVEGDDANNLELSAISLQAYALLLAKRYFEAVILIEPVLSEANLKPEEKIEFYYLMGRAHEALQKREEAIYWFQQVTQLDSAYRDARDRLQENFRSRLP